MAWSGHQHQAISFRCWYAWLISPASVRSVLFGARCLVSKQMSSWCFWHWHSNSIQLFLERVCGIHDRLLWIKGIVIRHFVFDWTWICNGLAAMAVSYNNCSLPKSAVSVYFRELSGHGQCHGRQVMCTSSLCVLEGHCYVVVSSRVSVLLANS